MEGLPRQEDGTRFIGTIERCEEGWRASYRLRMPPGSLVEDPRSPHIVSAVRLQRRSALQEQ
jgi:hypothetical protein